MTVDMTTTIPVGANQASQQTSKTAVDYQSFLKLLIAEMKNQDPTNPMDTSQYMSQFAQLSTVEQATLTNSKLDSLLSSQALTQADGLIGRNVSFTDTTGAAVTGKIASVSINSDGSVATLEDGTKVAVGPGLTLS